MKLPELSLICPMYKVAPFLPEFIDSLIAATNSPEVEILFVDDCCPEGSYQVCCDYLQRRADNIQFHFRVLQTPSNSGLGFARNTGLQAASGKYLGFVDSDDLLAPGYFAFLRNRVLATSPEIIEFGYREFRGLARELAPLQAPSEQLESSQLNPFTTQFFAWSRIYRADLVAGLSFQCDTLYEDVGYVLKAFARATVTERHSAALVFYRQREGSITSTRKSDYSNLLLNLIAGVGESLELFVQKERLLQCVCRKSLLVLLKGARIRMPQQRREFYRISTPAIGKLGQLLDAGSSLSAQMYLLLCRLACSVGRRL